MSLIASYTFDSGPPYASAVTGAPALATVLGSPDSVLGLLGNAVSFEGGLASNTLETASAGSLAFTGDISISLWVKQTDTAGIASPYVQLTSASGHTFLLSLGRVGSDVPFGSANDGAAVSASLASALTVNVWAHLCVTWNNSTGTVSIYKNGVLIDDTTDVSVVLTEVWTELLISGELCPTTLIDQMNVYDSVLSAAAVLALYNGGTPVASSPGVQIAAAHFFHPGVAAASGD